MRRAAFLLPLLLLTPASAVAHPATPSMTPPPLAAKLTACDSGPNPSDRSAGFEGSMPAVPNATALAMRFVLQARTDASAPFATVNAPTFNKWLKAQPRAAGFVFDKRVDQLDAGSQYRVLVRFRWENGGGKVVKTAQKASPPCREPDVRPDLSVSTLTVSPGEEGQDVYTVTVVNGGLEPIASPFDVGLQIGTAAPTTMSIPSLDAGGNAEISFTGPVCKTGTKLRVTADPGEVVDEADENDNTLVQSCA